MSPDREFRCCHCVFGVFHPQIHVFWGPMGKKSWISKNGDENGFHLPFRNFVNMVGTLCAERGRRQSKISENEDETHFTLISEIREQPIVHEWGCPCVSSRSRISKSQKWGWKRVFILIFENSWKPYKPDLFCSLKSVFCFVFLAWNSYWQVRFAKKRTRFDQFGSPEHRL